MKIKWNDCDFIEPVAEHFNVTLLPSLTTISVLVWSGKSHISGGTAKKRIEKNRAIICVNARDNLDTSTYQWTITIVNFGRLNHIHTAHRLYWNLSATVKCRLSSIQPKCMKKSIELQSNYIFQCVCGDDKKWSEFLFFSYWYGSLLQSLFLFFALIWTTFSKCMTYSRAYMLRATKNDFITSLFGLIMKVCIAIQKASFRSSKQIKDKAKCQNRIWTTTKEQRKNAVQNHAYVWMRVTWNVQQ